MRIELGNMFTPGMALDKGLSLIKRGKSRQGPMLVLYSVNVGNSTHYYVTFNHIVVCITNLFNVAQYTYSRGTRGQGNHV